MWSRPAALDLVIVEPAPSANGDVTESWSTVRPIIVPHGITAVQRRSPIKRRKRTPWHPSQEPHGVVERGGSREWFTDRLFVESKQAAGAEVGGATEGVTGGVAGGTGSALAIEPVQPPAAPFRVGEGIARPRKIKDVRPAYPVFAMSARVGGSVLIEATIGVDGKVHNARVLQSIAALDQAALDAVRQWEFEPSRVNGEPVSVMMVIVVTFALL